MSELIVELAGRRAGQRIRKDNGNLQFRYDGGYDGPPVSHAMPVRREAHPHAACHAVFGGLLPEGVERDTLARKLGVSPGNDYGLLAAIGGDCAGAVTLRPAGAAQPPRRPPRRLDPLELDAELRALPQRPLGADPDSPDSSRTRRSACGSREPRRCRWRTWSGRRRSPGCRT